MSDGAPADAQLVTDRMWLEAATPPLGRRWGPKMVFDPNADRILLYGGTEAIMLPTGGELTHGDLWEFDGASWNMLCGPCAPGPREKHALAFDIERNVLVLYGGSDEPSNAIISDELWEWDGTTWQMPAVGGSPPPALYDTEMAYDPVRKLTVLVGGTGPRGGSTTVYEWDGSTWTGVVPSNPPAVRQSNAVAYDARREGVVIYGGRELGGANLDDAHIWNGSNWSTLCSACTGTPRRAANIVYDPGMRELLLIGGFTGSAELAETWALREQTSVLLEDGAPPRRDSLGVAYDPSNDRVVIYGGNGGSCSSPDFNFGHCDNMYFYVAQ